MENKDTKNSKQYQYLTQCWVAGRPKQTISLDFALSDAMEDPNTPVLMMHSPFSRFILTIVDNSGVATKYPKANIRASEVPLLEQKYNNAAAERFRRMNHLGEYRGTDAGADSAAATSPAYTVAIRMGEFKGKTPAELLIEDGNNAFKLERHAQFLGGANLAKFPKNQEVIDAINEALALFRGNKLTGEAAKSATAGIQRDSITIFSEEFKIMSVNDPAKRMVAKIYISCEMNLETNPWKIQIENTLYPFINGAVAWDNPNHRPEPPTICTAYLTDAEMAAMISAMKNLKFIFESKSFNKAMAFVKENAWSPTK